MDISRAAVRHAFFARFLEHRQAAVERTLAEYLALFPGHEEEIADLFRRLRDSEDERSGDRDWLASRNGRASSSPSGSFKRSSSRCLAAHSRTDLRDRGGSRPLETSSVSMETLASNRPWMT